MAKKNHAKIPFMTHHMKGAEPYTIFAVISATVILAMPKPWQRAF